MKLIYKSTLIVAFAANIITGGVYAQNNNEEVVVNSPFSYEASYTGDLVSNFKGGIKTGTAYLGLANLKAGFDTEKANWWKGGQLFVIHDNQPLSLRYFLKWLFAPTVQLE